MLHWNLRERKCTKGDATLNMHAVGLSFNMQREDNDEERERERERERE